MITINGIKITPTIFPDETSQVWKLPKEIFEAPSLKIDWRFEEEREIIDLYGISQLYMGGFVHLHIPYLPYARQDKPIDNDSTFNLAVFAELINNLYFDLITSVDVHNPAATKTLINDFANIHVCQFHKEIIERVQPNFIIYPDYGAECRYKIPNISKIVFHKRRNAATGEIIAHFFVNDFNIKPGQKFLIIDDICDGGATFIGITKELRKHAPDADISLCVTHGLFSKGRKVLEDEGIKIFTTNSLLKNNEGFRV